MNIKLGKIVIRETLAVILLTIGAFFFYRFIKYQTNKNLKITDAARAGLLIFGPTLLVMGIYLLFTIDKNDEKMPKHK